MFAWQVEDLPDINTLYEPRELAQLFARILKRFMSNEDVQRHAQKCVDSFVHLVLPPGANAGVSAHSRLFTDSTCPCQVAHTPEMFLQSMLASLTPVVAQPTGVQLGCLANSERK